MSKKFSRLISSIALFVLLQMSFLVQGASATCIPISTPQGLLDIANDMTASYCLTKDIDASSLGTINTLAGGAEFSGTLDGRGYTIRNMNVITPGGFIATLASTGLIQNLILANVKTVRVGGCSGCQFGTLVGVNLGTIRNVSAILIDVKEVTADYAGGLVGKNLGTIQQSYTTGRILNVSNAGGLVGWNTGIVEKSYSAVRLEGVFCSESGGGLVQENTGSIRQSFAVGQVVTDCTVSTGPGLLGGLTSSSGELIQSYSTAGVKVNGSAPSSPLAAGLTAWSESTYESYAAGRVDCDACGYGLIGSKSPFGITVNSYWDILTSTKLMSDSGIGFGTGTLKSRLRSGFNPDMWGISTGFSYPFLKVDNTYLPRMRSTSHSLYISRLVSFKSTLALLSTVKGLFTILPIGQLQPFQYRNYRLDFASTACKAAVYTMIGRIIGEMNPSIWPVPGSVDSTLS